MGLVHFLGRAIMLAVVAMIAVTMFAMAFAAPSENHLKPSEGDKTWPNNVERINGQETQVIEQKGDTDERNEDRDDHVMGAITTNCIF